MINMALFKQIGIFFAFPLLLAIIHSVFGIKFINLILQTMGMSSMLASVGITFVFLVVIYGGYFIITYLCSKSIYLYEFPELPGYHKSNHSRFFFQNVFYQT